MVQLLSESLIKQHFIESYSGKRNDTHERQIIQWTSVGGFYRRCMGNHLYIYQSFIAGFPSNGNPFYSFPYGNQFSVFTVSKTAAGA
mgnify:CR=1 FL=1